MKEYISPELEIVLFDNGEIACDTVVGSYGHGGGGIEEDWYRPEYDDE